MISDGAATPTGLPRIVNVRYSITEAAHHLVFCDQAHLRRVFRKHFIGPLRIYLSALSKRLCTTRDGEILAGLFYEARQNPAFAQMFLEQFLNVRREHLRAMLQRGQARGEIRPEVSLDVALNMIYGPRWYWILIRKEPVDVTEVNELVNLALKGLC